MARRQDARPYDAGQGGRPREGKNRDQRDMLTTKSVFQGDNYLPDRRETDQGGHGSGGNPTSAIVLPRKVVRGYPVYWLG
jgi:hypothetical protein